MCIEVVTSLRVTFTQHWVGTFKENLLAGRLNGFKRLANSQLNIRDARPIVA